MSNTKTKRTLPVIISAFCFIACIVSLVTPFIYASIIPKSLLGFQCIFGGVYNISSFRIVIDFNVGLFIGLLILFLAGIFAFYSRKINQANTILTILLLIASTVLYFLSYRFCMQSIYGNVGFQNTCYLSCGPYIVIGINCFTILLSSIDMAYKRR